MTVFTFLGTVDSLETVARAYQDSLGEVVQSFEIVEGAYHYTLHDESVLVLAQGEEGKNKEAFLAQKEKWMEFYQNVDTEHKEIQENLLEQIQQWNIEVKIQFEETENEDRTACLFGSALETAENLKGFVMLDDLTLLDSQADVVLDEEGYSDLEEFIPFSL